MIGEVIRLADYFPLYPFLEYIKTENIHQFNKYVR